MTTIQTPWDQCKVGYDCADLEAFDRWWDILTPIGRKRMLPKGWKFTETYASPCAAFLIFDVEGFPTLSEGQRVRLLIDRVCDRAAKRAL